MAKKVKLNSEQKRRLDKLKKLQNSGQYIGDQDLKEVVLDGGKYAVLSMRNPVFESIVCADDEDSAREVMRRNYSSFARIVNLTTGEIIVEQDRPWLPRLTNEEI